MNILALNCGSSSIKYQLIEFPSEKVLVKNKIAKLKTKADQSQAMKNILEELKDYSIGGVAHRVVHGGEHFFEAVKVDSASLVKMKSVFPLAPLHNPANIQGIELAQEVFPSIEHVAIFDTAFHRTMPKKARTYALPFDLASKHHISRYGFHGPSHQYVSSTLSKHLDRPLNELKIISCHLGNGASVAAIEYGHSVDTSMGLTPLEGLVMGTRCGDMDPSIVLQLMKAEGLSADELDQLLNKESGLKGISGISNDLREIEASAIDGNERARLAIQVFSHRVRKYIGAYLAVMNGADAIIFTGGIGENSASMRMRILQGFGFVGLHIDEDKNVQLLEAGKPVLEVTKSNSRLKAFAVKTNEELMMAREAHQLINKTNIFAELRPIPIAISARHVHLNQETLDLLFGPNSKLTKYKDISQPGQYASEQKVNLIGPRGRIDNVRILGPLRPKNQIEVARTDEFKLGVDAPIRRSGRVSGSAPITLEGPNGKIDLEEGLICAWRHIHMTTKDAEYYGVQDGDEVEVKITGGPRDLTYGDVLVRVKDSYKLEMHIDTDEANAAELSQGSPGELVYSDAPKDFCAALSKKCR